MLLCVREFILDALEEAKRGRLPQRNLVNLLESVRQVITDPKADRSSKLWHLDLTQVWPLRSLKASDLTKIINFLQHRLPSIQPE